MGPDIRLALALTALLGTAACSQATPGDEGHDEGRPATEAVQTSADAVPVPASVQAAAFSGHWGGVEGTYMTVTPLGTGGFEVVIADLDGPKTYAGDLQADGLHIERDGATLIIRPGDGEATGMKWLGDKTDCLIVAANEGYCRD